MNIVTFVKGEDWEGLYINGQLVEQGHKVPPSNQLLHVVNLEGEFTHEELIPNQQWLEDRGMLPNDLSEVIAD